MHWYLEAVKKYVEFDGRARRKEYWMFQLFNILVVFALIIIGAIMESAVPGRMNPNIFSVLVIVYFLAMLIPSLAVMVRRLHDTGKSGWWFFILFIPAFGELILLFFMVTDSEGPNKYGPNPKSNAVVDGQLNLG
jgi:uncharacterized membrane protein YhaH (DUF805 family)